MKKGIMTCDCGVQTTLDAIDAGYGALLADCWLCPDCWEKERALIDKLWGDSLFDDIPF